MEQPAFSEELDPERHVCRLKRSIYVCTTIGETLERRNQQNID